MIGRGVAGADVAKAAGCSRAAVYKILAQHGEDIQRSIQPLLDRAADRDAEIKRLRAKGMGVKRIADAVGTSVSYERDTAPPLPYNRLEGKQ
jgi:DNA invertase Pin-like site-specific DNA recombinase